MSFGFFQNRNFVEDWGSITISSLFDFIRKSSLLSLQQQGNVRKYKQPSPSAVIGCGMYITLYEKRPLDSPWNFMLEGWFPNLRLLEFVNVLILWCCDIITPVWRIEILMPLYHICRPSLILQILLCHWGFRGLKPQIFS